MRIPTIAVLMDLPPERRYHQATVAAVGHAASAGLACTVVVPTDTIAGRAADALGDAVVVGPGSPYRDAEAVHDVIRSARERGVPLIGT